MTAPATPPREGRGLDLLALVLLVAGLLIAAYGLAGWRGLISGPIITAPGELAVTRAAHFERVIMAGAAVIVVSLLVAIGSTARRLVRARRARTEHA
ncbi:MAG TPA: hypothetical protein VFK13_15390 [Gemmatimonadaceae bacterium]|nr:hypothetical protein [Gemmatimonadaceae bacterium]